jgi:hypothetical protein
MSHADFLNAATCSHAELGGRRPLLSGLHLRRTGSGRGRSFLWERGVVDIDIDGRRPPLMRFFENG